MVIKRTITQHLISLAQQFPAVAVMGPRQSGKTTLAKATFPDYAYVSLEDIDRRLLAQEDPRGFLLSFEQSKGVIIDEIQEVPELFSYMQGIIDRGYRPGHFIVTGSQHFLMHEKITQTLAGRIALLTLLPFSAAEMQEAKILPSSMEALVLKGGYPRLYVQPVDPQSWCANYVSTYVEKDVRQVTKITDVLSFQRFLKLCAARVGNLLNYAELARDCDISPNTAKQWISILETSFIIKLVAPYYKNFNKRVVKSPKLYFYDSALVCWMLGIRTQEEFFNHPSKGALFESFVMSEMFKYCYNGNKVPALYFWRDVQGHEVDCVIEKSFGVVVPVEIKAGKTMSQDFFKGLVAWQEIAEQPEDAPLYVVYGGQENFVHRNKNIVAWHAVAEMLDKIY